MPISRPSEKSKYRRPPLRNFFAERFPPKKSLVIIQNEKALTDFVDKLQKLRATPSPKPIIPPSLPNTVKDLNDLADPIIRQVNQFVTNVQGIFEGVRKASTTFQAAMSAMSAQAEEWTETMRERQVEMAWREYRQQEIALRSEQEEERREIIQEKNDIVETVYEETRLPKNVINEMPELENFDKLSLSKQRQMLERLKKRVYRLLAIQYMADMASMQSDEVLREWIQLSEEEADRLFTGDPYEVFNGDDVANIISIQAMQQLAVALDLDPKELTDKAQPLTLEQRFLLMTRISQFYFGYVQQSNNSLSDTLRERQYNRLFDYAQAVRQASGKPSFTSISDGEWQQIDIAALEIARLGEDKFLEKLAANPDELEIIRLKDIASSNAIDAGFGATFIVGIIDWMRDIRAYNSYIANYKTPPDIDDPNNIARRGGGGQAKKGPELEEATLRHLQEQGYEIIAATDQEVTEKYNISGKAVDHVAKKGDTWIIAESKGGTRIDNAVKQLQNTWKSPQLQAEIAGNPVEFQVYTDTNSYDIMAGPTENGMYGYHVDEFGYLYWNDSNNGNARVYETINNQRIQVIAK